MSSLLFLTTDDFAVSPSENGDVLHIDVRGFSLILFYSTHCVHCQKLIPIFKHLPDVVTGCQFGMINISTNRRLIAMSAASITPIKYVPLIILYINGRPYMRYDGLPHEDDIRRFILDVSNAVHESGFSQVTRERGIPSYSIGNPLYGETDVTYLEFDEQVGYKKSL